MSEEGRKRVRTGERESGGEKERVRGGEKERVRRGERESQRRRERESQRRGQRKEVKIWIKIYISQMHNIY